MNISNLSCKFVFQLHLAFSSFCTKKKIMDEKKGEVKTTSSSKEQVLDIVVTTGDEDVHLQKECNQCCNEMLGMKESNRKCGWGNCQYASELVLQSFVHLLLRPAVRALKWNLLRIVEGGVALVFNPIFFLVDLFGCSNCSKCCDYNGECNFVWPFFPSYVRGCKVH